MASTEYLGENTDKNNHNILEFNVLAVFQQALDSYLIFCFSASEKNGI
jgi:hypothetical protein